MRTVLQINSSIFGDSGHSTRMANDFTRQWRAHNPDVRMVKRDLVAQPLPQLDADRVSAWTTPASDRDAPQREAAALSDDLIRELDAAELLVLGVPMYNFSIPSQLKAWIDQVTRAGLTFRYTEHGPVGLLRPKPVVVFSARGGHYANTGHDHQTPLLRQVLGLVGLDDVRFVYAEGVNLGEDARAESVARASREVAALVDELAEQLAGESTTA